MQKNKFLIFLTVFTLMAPIRGQALEPSVMSGLQQLLTTENNQRVKLDKHLTETLDEMRATPVNASQTNLLETSLIRYEAKVSDIKQDLNENHLRIEFLNSFISAMESSKDARVDAPKILAEMAHKEILESVETATDQKIWLFEIYLSIAVRDIMEPSEKFTDFLKSFMTYSTLHDPRNPGDFSKSRNYLGGNPDQKANNPTED